MQEEHYTLSKLSAGDLSQELDRLWADLQEPNSELSRQAAQEGIDLNSIRSLKRDEAIKIKRDEAGFGFDVDHIILAFVAHGVVEVVRATWMHVLYPVLKNRFGEDAIEPRK